jgi:UDPglucose 6-dehydrogenase
MASLCEKVGADVHMVAKGMGFDQRIGSKFLHPGPGYGGSCLPKDTHALLKMAEEHDVELCIVNSAVRANERQKEFMAEKIKDAMGVLEGKIIAILGLSFKPNTDDIREAPSLYIIESLLKEKANIRVYDPVSMKEVERIIPRIKYCKDPYDAVKGADALVIMTEWNQFRNLELDKLKKLLKGLYFFDLRNVYEPQRLREKGFKYFCVGRV